MLLAVSYWLLAVGCWLWAAFSYWLLAIGFGQLLAVGRWLLAECTVNYEVFFLK